MKKFLPSKRQILVLVFLCLFLVPIYYFYNKNKQAAEVGNVQARWSDDLVDSIGINTHFQYPGYNFVKEDLIKDQSRPLFDIYEYAPGNNIPKNITIAPNNSSTYSTYYRTLKLNDSTSTYDIDFLGVRNYLTENNKLYETQDRLISLLQDSGIRHIRDGFANLFFNAADSNDIFYKLQNPGTKEKTVTPNLVMTNFEQGLKSFCDNDYTIPVGGTLRNNSDPRTHRYELRSYPYCYKDEAKTIPIPPKEQAAMCVLDIAKAYKNGGPIPDCMIILDQRSTDFFDTKKLINIPEDYVPKPGDYPPGDHPLIRPSLNKVNIDSIEGANEVDVGGGSGLNYNNSYEIGIPWHGCVTGDAKYPTDLTTGCNCKPIDTNDLSKGCKNVLKNLVVPEEGYQCQLKNPADPNSGCKTNDKGEPIYEIDLIWKKYYRFHNWYDYASTKIFPPTYPSKTTTDGNWYRWTPEHAKSISEKLKGADGKYLVDFASPTMSFLYYYDEAFEKIGKVDTAYSIYAPNKQKEFRDAIKICHGSGNYLTPDSDPKIKNDCLESKLKNDFQGLSRAIAMKKAAKDTYDASSIVNQHMYCGQDWQYICIHDYFGRELNTSGDSISTDPYTRIQNLKSGIEKILGVNTIPNNTEGGAGYLDPLTQNPVDTLTQYMQPEAKPMYLTEWNYGATYKEINTTQRITPQELIKTPLSCTQKIIEGTPVAIPEGKTCDVNSINFDRSTYTNYCACAVDFTFKPKPDDTGRLDEAIQNKYLQRGIFDNFDIGIDKSYIYEFYNNYFVTNALRETPLDLYKDFKFYLTYTGALNETKRPVDCDPTSQNYNAANEGYCKILRDRIRTLYTLKDENSSNERFYGIVRNDFSKKPSYYSIQNIIKILRDPLHNELSKTKTPGSLNIGYTNRASSDPTSRVPSSNNTNEDASKSANGNEARVQKTLLQKHDGRYFLALRNEDYANHYTKVIKDFAQELLIDNMNPITVSINNPIKRIKIYDPGNYYSNYEDTSLYDQNGNLKPIYDSCETQNDSGSCLPTVGYDTSDYHNFFKAYNRTTTGSTININVPDRVIIIEIIPETSITKVMGVTTSKPDGSYKAGETIDIDVVFNSDVTIDGTPSLILSKVNANLNTRAVYVKGSGTNTLTFRYTIQEGDNTDLLNYASVEALSVINLSKKDNPTEFAKILIDHAYARGAIIDPIDGNEVDYLLPDPVSTTNPYNFISANHISIDAIKPTIAAPDSAVLYPDMDIPIKTTGSDNSGDITYTWSVISSPQGGTATINNPTLKDITVRTNLAGSYRLNLNVKDRAGNEANKEIVLDIHKLGDIDGLPNDSGVITTDFDDFSILLNNWGIPTNPMADLARSDGKGIVDFTDFSVLLSCWGK